MSKLEMPRPQQRACARDRYGREVRSLRISVTQRCDLNCTHCHREGQAPSNEEMTPAEISRIVRVAAGMGIGKVKITGGEPLMRDDIAEIIGSIAPQVREVSLTTNGSRLARSAEALKAAGLARVNVSLHSLDPEVNRKLCGKDHTQTVIDGIRTAVEAGLTPVKVNMVVLKGENDAEIGSMMEFCARAGAVLQLIEYECDEENSHGRDFISRYYPLDGVESLLRKDAVDTSVNELHRRRQYKVPADGGVVSVEVVRPMHNTEFCSNCTRIRLSSDGKLKPCLLEHGGAVDLLGSLRSGATDDTLRGLFEEAISRRRPYWS